MSLTRTEIGLVLGACLVVGVGLLLTQAIRQPGADIPVPVAAASRQHSAAPGALHAKSPEPINPLKRDPLGLEATSYLFGRAGAVLAAVYDIASGRTWTIGNGPPQAEASIVKLDILETLFAQRRINRTELSGSEELLAAQMMEDSDNSDATLLWYAVGGAAGIRMFNAAAGLEGTSPSLCVACPGFPWPGWGLTTTTPTDQIALLRELVKPGSLFADAQRSYGLRLMENVDPSQRWGVSGGVPPNVTVAVKDGWLPLNSSQTDWQINSVGWISGQGRNYLMAVLTTGNLTEQYGINTVDQLSGIVWNAMR